MSVETGVLVDLDGKPIFWHLPKDRNAVALPDSRQLWDVIWENRERISGFAHSHPGSGVPGPSYEDVTTFAAVEAALGKRLVWWITSRDEIVELAWEGPDRYSYRAARLHVHPMWLRELRDLSYGTGNDEHDWVIYMAAVEFNAGGFPGSLNRPPGNRLTAEQKGDRIT